MTLSYTTGLTVGSLLAYMLDACLGPPIQAKQICPKPRKTIASVGNVTLNILTNAVTSTFSSVEKITRLPKVKSTAATLTTVLSTSLALNSTNVLNNGITNLTTTALPKILANATATISNTILH